nr:hypothetical protein [uncultured Lachnoanaerobaculum sp.]
MAICLINKSGGGITSDDVTASKAQVLQGYRTITSDSDDEPVQGTMVNRGYHGPDTSEMWYYPQESGYVIRIEEGYYHKGGQWKPYVLASPSLVKSAVNYHPEKTLSDTRTCEEQGQIKMVDTKLNNYTNNQARNIGIDSGRGKLWMEMGHGNAYYFRDDNVPHVETDASKLGTAGADAVLQWQTASSQHGLKFEGTIPRWICTTGDVISAVNGEGFAWDDGYAGRGRGIVMKIPNKHFIQDANYAFLASPNLYPQNIRAGVNINGVVGTMVDYSVGRPVFENATFNALYVGGVANKDFQEAGIYRDRTVTASNYSRYAGGTTINVSAGSNFHLWSSGQYVGFVLDRAILFTFFRWLKITYKLDVRMNTGSYNRRAGVDVYVHLYDAANRSSLIGGMHKMHSSAENAGSTYNGDTYEMIIDTSSINKDAFVALCASAYSDYNMSSAIGSVTFTKIELIN